MREIMRELFEIVHEDAGLLIINKPAGLVCHPTKGDEYSSLISRARLYLAGDAQPQLINRLDRETSGIVVIAKNPDSALRLRRIWEGGGVRKVYLAIVHGHLLERIGVIDLPLGRDLESPVAIKDKVRADGAAASTSYRLIRTFVRNGGDFSLLEVRPSTGRKHQIRIHLAHLGHSIVGDKLYGHDERCYLDFVEGRLDESRRAALLLPHHALHASSVSFDWEKGPVHFHASPNLDFVGFCGQLGLERKSDVGEG